MPADPARYHVNFQAETDAAAIYDALAGLEKQPTLAEVYRRMAASEHRHAKFWAEQLRTAGHDPGPGRPTWRASRQPRPRRPPQRPS
jgi:rubrerythrin